jgi:hypothetical protein
VTGMGIEMLEKVAFTRQQLSENHRILHNAANTAISMTFL